MTSGRLAATSWTPWRASLRRLRTDHIDLYQIHGNDSVTPVEETLRALDTLVQQGKVRYVGCSKLAGLEAREKPLASPSSATSPGSTRFRRTTRSPAAIWNAKLIPLLTSEKVGLLVWSPLAGGLLSGKFNRTNQKPADSRRTDYDFPRVDKERTWKILDVMAPIAKAHDCSAARVALAWLLVKPAVTSVIVGAKRLDQLQDNLAAIELTLTPDELRRLDEVSALPPEYPGWVLPYQGADRLEFVDSRAFFLRPADGLIGPARSRTKSAPAASADVMRHVGDTYDFSPAASAKSCVSPLADQKHRSAPLPEAQPPGRGWVEGGSEGAPPLRFGTASHVGATGSNAAPTLTAGARPLPASPSTLGVRERTGPLVRANRQILDAAALMFYICSR